MMFSHSSFAGFLFDMDGTLLTSIEASQRVWGRWAARFGLDASTFLPNAHGMKVRDVVRQLDLPNVDPDEEADAILAAELADMDGVTAVPGAGSFLVRLPAHRWAIVTSAPRALALRRLDAAGLPVPPVLVCASDVAQGKPDPSCFILAAERLGVAIDQCLVFEDAPAGILAAERSGATVVVVTHAHPGRDEVHATAIDDYTNLSLEQTSTESWRVSYPGRVGA
jgi:sugar-phosphatase